MAADKRSSYPSRQTRHGPAPLASFEDLSDEIESPTEKNSHSLPEIQEELKLYADAATPSTPHFLATTPSTPQAELSSASTPRVGMNESWETNIDDTCVTCDGAFPSQSVSRDSVLDSSQEGISYMKTVKNQRTASQMNGIKNSVSSSFMDDVKGAEAASVLANSLPERSATPECLPQKPPMKKNSLTSSQAGGRASQTPSRTPSPNSPRGFFSFFKHKDESSEPGSPSSPKSPRKTSFTNLFKIGGRDDSDHSASSPTRRRSSLSMFFKGGKDSTKNKKLGSGSGESSSHMTSKGKKEASNRNVFSNLFRKDKSPVKLTLQATSVDIPIELDLGTGTGWTSREISLHSHLSDLEDRDHVADVVDDDYDNDHPVDHVDLPYKDNDISTNVQVHADINKAEPQESKKNEDILFDNSVSVSMSTNSCVFSSTVAQVELSEKPVKVKRSEEKVREKIPSTEDKISSGSEQESDFDPSSLKKRVTNEDNEAETLIDDEIEYDEFPVNVDMISDTSKKLPMTPIRRQRAVDITTVPIDRPRSSTPLSVMSLEAYIQTASPPPDGIAHENEKLKVSLPGEEFIARSKSPRKLAVKNWHEFCQEVLHSPRSRRRDSEDASISQTAISSTSSSSNPSASWVTFENVVETKKPLRFIGTRRESQQSTDIDQSTDDKKSPFSSDKIYSTLSEGRGIDFNVDTASSNQTSDSKMFSFPSDNFVVTIPTSCENGVTTEQFLQSVSEAKVLSDPPSSSTISVSEQDDTLNSISSHVKEEGSTLPKQTDVSSLVSEDKFCQRTFSAVAPNTLLNGKKEMVLNHECTETANRLSSSDSVSSGDFPIRLDSLEGMDPLLDPASEAEFTLDDAEKNFHSNFPDLNNFQSNKVVCSDDLKRPNS